eukprot:254381-Alexandrium_andersonii.AAC.1
MGVGLRPCVAAVGQDVFRPAGQAPGDRPAEVPVGAEAGVADPVPTSKGVAALIVHGTPARYA